MRKFAVYLDTELAVDVANVALFVGNIHDTYGFLHNYHNTHTEGTLYVDEIDEDNKTIDSTSALKFMEIYESDLVEQAEDRVNGNVDVDPKVIELAQLIDEAEAETEMEAVNEAYDIYNNNHMVDN